MAKRKKEDEEVTNEFAAEAEASGDLSHDEAVAVSKEGPGTTTDQPVKLPDTDGTVKKPELQGHRPEEYGPPKNGSSSVQRVQDIGKPQE